MDAVTDFVEKIIPGRRVDRFCVMSEVPFVAWMSAVDPRVKSSIPIVTDLLNATASFEQQYR